MEFLTPNIDILGQFSGNGGWLPNCDGEIMRIAVKPCRSSPGFPGWFLLVHGDSQLMDCIPKIFLVGGYKTILKNVKVSWDDDIPYMENKIRV